MTWLYVLEVAVIVAGFVGMLRLRRAADRSWRKHQILAARRTIQLRIIADASGFVAHMRAASAATEQLRRDLSRGTGPFEQFGRDIDRLTARIRKAMRDSIPELRDKGEA